MRDVPLAVLPQCRDGADNDANARVDYPADGGCASAEDESEARGPACEPSYPTVCIRLKSEVGDLNCANVPFTNFTVRHNVVPDDPHVFDGNRDGVGCEA